MKSRLSFIGVLALAAMCASCANSPHISSSNPASTIAFEPSTVRTVSLFGKNLARPDTTGATALNDIEVYFRYSQPEGPWKRFKPPYFSGWSPTQIGLNLAANAPADQPQIPYKGEVQFYVNVRENGSSNVWTMNVGP